MVIIKNLLGGPKRFTELKRDLHNITQKVLTSNLRSMEKDGLLTRTTYDQIPPRVEYELTEIGYKLKPVIDSMINWGKMYKINFYNK